ncbi:MAG: hypothetical protein WD715_12555 [Dongiaceae bacterium]
MNGSGFPFATRTGLATGFGAGFAATCFAATGVGFTAPVFATGGFTKASFAAGAFAKAALAAGFDAGTLATGFAFAAGFAGAKFLLTAFLLTAFAGLTFFLLVAVFVTFVAFFFVVTGFCFEAALSRRRTSAVLAVAPVVPPGRLPDAADLAAAGRPAGLVFFFAFLSAPCRDAVLLVAMDRLSCPIGRSPSQNHAT